jgi:hypothetical protein
MFLTILSFLLSSVSFAGGSPAVKHVVQVVFENADYADVLRTPYFAKLTERGALFTNFSAVTHPSEPNYIAMIAGDRLGAYGDGEYNFDATHLGTLMTRKGLSWKAYAEDFPGNCFLGMHSGNYARRHVPFMSFLDVTRNPSECAKVVRGEQFFSDISSRNLPAYSMYVPNLVNDGHDTNISYAARWFESAMGSIFNDPIVMKDTLFIITFDESESYLRQNKVFTLFLGANVSPGLKVAESVSHYSVLRYIEDQFDLGSLGRNDVSAMMISNIWK